MKYYLIKYKNGLFAYKDSTKYYKHAERIKILRPSVDIIFNACNTSTINLKYFSENGFILLESENSDEIVEWAAIESL